MTGICFAGNSRRYLEPCYGQKVASFIDFFCRKLSGGNASYPENCTSELLYE